MNYSGLVIAVSGFLIIGLFHPIVIKAEYYFSKGCWPVFLAVGLALIGGSMFVEEITLGALLGLAGCSCLWSIAELFEQEKRVARGWFPQNPRRSGKETQQVKHESVYGDAFKQEECEEFHR